MPAGLEVLNDDGAYLIDGENIAPYLLVAGTGVTQPASYSPSLNPYDVKITLPMDTEICVVSCPGVWMYAGVWVYNGVKRLMVRTNVQAAFSYFGFKMGLHPPTGFGLEVYSANGARVYTSSGKLLGVHQSRLFNFSTWQPSRITGRIYAMSVGYPRWFELMDGWGNISSYVDAWHYNQSTGVVTRGVFDGSKNIVSTDTSQIDGISGGFPTIMSVDVTPL